MAGTARSRRRDRRSAASSPAGARPSPIPSPTDPPVCPVWRLPALRSTARAHDGDTEAMIMFGSVFQEEPARAPPPLPCRRGPRRRLRPGRLQAGHPRHPRRPSREGSRRQAGRRVRPRHRGGWIRHVSRQGVRHRRLPRAAVRREFRFGQHPTRGWRTLSRSGPRPGHGHVRIMSNMGPAWHGSGRQARPRPA